MSQAAFKVGDVVAVKPGVLDVDMGGDIGGWQGRILHIDPAEQTVGLQWDSITLQTMPASLIEHCEAEGLEWAEMGLGLDEIVPARARDTPRAVASLKAALSAQYRWFFLGDEQGRRVHDVVNSATGPGEWAAFMAWHTHLAARLVFPFTAEVSEPPPGPVRLGARVTVLDIADLVDPYGTIVSVRHRGGTYVVPLCDLKAVGLTRGETRQIVQDYAVWFANR